MDTIISHNHCPDGFVASYIAKKAYPDAEVILLDHGTDVAPLIESLSDRYVMMFDFSFRTRELNDRLASVARYLHIYDHHKTAQAVLDGAPYATFDMNRSGAGLAWDYLFGKDAALRSARLAKGYYRNRPWWVDYVEDRDLWTWKQPKSREVCAYLGTLPFTAEAWDKLEGTSWTDFIEAGEGALAHIAHYIREAVQQAKTGSLNGHKVGVLNIPYLNCSEVGNELAKMNDFSLTWFERQDDVIQFSLRSIGDFDVSQIAKQFGGGGHKNASGFQMPYLKGRELLDAIIGRV